MLNLNLYFAKLDSGWMRIFRTGGLLGFVLLGSPALSQIYQLVPQTGSINWQQQMVIAFGVGQASPHTPPGEVRREARKRALEQAYSHLAELIQQINIDGNHRGRDIVEQHVQLQSDLNRLARTARILEVHHEPSGRAEVSVVLSLDTIAGWIAGVLADSVAGGERFPEPAARTDTSTHLAREVTGIIIDGRNTDLQPALFPLILDEQGTVLYSSRWHDPTGRAPGRIMAYAPDLSAAREQSRVAENPAIVQVLRAQGRFRADIVVDSTARRILQHNPHIVSQGRFVVMID